MSSSNDSFLSTDHLKSDLRGRSVRGGAVTIIAQGLKFFIRMGSTVVLARLLTPQDFGLIAMVTAVTGFVMMFKDMGLSIATVQRAEITHAQVSTLFWINVAVSLLLMLITAALGPAISWFYGDPRLTWITVALASGFIFGGLTIQHQALLRRQMRFTALAAVEIAGMSAGVLAAIISAFYGFGYWALVVMQVVMEAVIALGVWVACGWRPGLPVRGSGVKEMLKFGGNLTGFNVVNYFARNADNLLIGKFWGAKALGLYSKAYSIMMLPIAQIRDPLGAVAMPALSHIQGDPPRYKRYYIKVTGIIAFIGMPLMVFAFICGKEIILLVLGSQWQGSTKIFKVLCTVAFIQPAATTTGIVLISLGQSKRFLRIGIISSAITVVSFTVGLPWGGTGVAVGYAIGTYASFVPVVHYCLRRSAISLKDFFRAVSRPAAVSICAGLVSLTFYPLLRGENNLIVIISILAVEITAYVSIMFLIPEGRRMIRELISLSRSFSSSHRER